MLEFVLFSSICGIIGFTFLALPEDNHWPTESLIITCATNSGWSSITLYDRSTDIFKYYHETEGCDENMFINREIPISFEKSFWKSTSNIIFLPCEAFDKLCSVFNPKTPPNKDSLQIIYGSIGNGVKHGFECVSADHILVTQTSGSGNPKSNVNSPFFVKGTKGAISCSGHLSSSSNSALIYTRALLNHGTNTFQYGSLGSIFVLLPKIYSSVNTDNGYIFKAVMNTTHKLPYMATMCLKNGPSKECGRYGSKVIYKEAISGISLVVEDGLFSNDVYMEIAGWRLGAYKNSLYVYHEIMITHRVNKRVLEESQEKVFSKGNGYGTLYFHFQKCDAGGIPCDAEEDGKVRVSLKIYGVTTLKEVKKLYIQADREERFPTCDTMGSHCVVELTTARYRDMIIHYEYSEKVCLWKHVAVTESYTKVCNDISMSITVVDHQDK